MVRTTDACPPGKSAAVGAAGLSVTADVVPVLAEPEPLPDPTQYAVAEPATRRTSETITTSGIVPRLACLAATLTLNSPGIRGS
jgi:hypothetical protein